MKFLDCLHPSNFCFLLQGANSGLMLDIAASEKDVHADFYNGKVDKIVPYIQKNHYFIIPRFRRSL